jgi:hypothetical protein
MADKGRRMLDLKKRGKRRLKLAFIANNLHQHCMSVAPRKLLGYASFLAILAVLLVNELRQGEIRESLASISPFTPPAAVGSSLNSNANQPLPVVGESRSDETEIGLPPVVTSPLPAQATSVPTLPDSEVATDTGTQATQEFESAGADSGRARTRAAVAGFGGGGSSGGFGGGGFGIGFGGSAAGGQEAPANFFFVSDDSGTNVPPIPTEINGAPDVTSNPFTVVGKNGDDLKTLDVDSPRNESNDGGDDPKQNPPGHRHVVPDNTSVLGSITLVLLCFAGLRHRITSLS